MDSPSPKKSWIGQSVERLEDPPLVAGRGEFAGDINFPHQLYMRMVRSSHAHGRIVSIDTSAARAVPGVFAVWTADDIIDVPPIDFREGSIPALDPYRQPCLANGFVRYVGDPVAAVFATDQYIAEDAVVLLAYATARKAGITEAAAWMEETWQLLEQRYWDADAGLYRDEADVDWHFSSYRGQNANMHMCEAMLAAYQASDEPRYLERALLLADHITRRQATKAGGLVWEHYDSDWNVDWDYHRDDPKHLFRPWGFQPGHLTEWAKLLLILEPLLLERGREENWLLPTAMHLFDTALARAWDAEHGGISYGFAPDGSVCDGDKYFWVQAESLAAAALLHARTGLSVYDDWYGKLWAYAWQHFVDHNYGAWYRILTHDNRKIDDEKSPAGKTDYHTMGACYELLNVLPRR